MIWSGNGRRWINIRRAGWGIRRRSWSYPFSRRQVRRCGGLFDALPGSSWPADGECGPPCSKNLTRLCPDRVLLGKSEACPHVMERCFRQPFSRQQRLDCWKDFRVMIDDHWTACGSEKSSSVVSASQAAPLRRCLSPRRCAGRALMSCATTCSPGELGFLLPCLPWEC